jgi:hypothetical protein
MNIKPSKQALQRSRSKYTKEISSIAIYIQPASGEECEGRKALLVTATRVTLRDEDEASTDCFYEQITATTVG